MLVPLVRAGRADAEAVSRAGGLQFAAHQASGHLRLAAVAHADEQHAGAWGAADPCQGLGRRVFPCHESQSSVLLDLWWLVPDISAG